MSSAQTPDPFEGSSPEPTEESFDDYAAEEHASKVFALWEIASPESELSSDEAPIPSSASDVNEALPVLPRARTTRNALFGGAFLTLFLAIAGSIVIFSGAPPSPTHSAPDEEAPPPPPTHAVAEQTPVPAATPPASSPPSRPILRRLRIRTVPSSATLLLDGRIVANPFDGRLPDGASLALVAQTTGFHDASQHIDLSEDRELILRLEPQEQHRSRRRHAPR